ncbi:unnamed protein product [Alopecurus aequalis]
MQGRLEKIPIWPETSNGQPKNRVQVEDAIIVVCNSNFCGIDVELTHTQSDNYNGIISATGARNSYLHYLSDSDIENDYLRISKTFSETLNLKKSGYALLSVMGSAPTEAKYAKCADGRTRFLSGWHEFSRDNNFAAGMVLLMLFQMIDYRTVSILFHVL